MKFFDYKFILLLGLTLVVYFIYRELEYLRTKVEKLETDIKNTDKLECKIKPEPEILEKSENSGNMEIKKTPINIKMDLSSSSSSPKLNNINQEQNVETNIVEAEKVTNYDIISGTSESESESELYSDDSGHLEIYSNDNECFDENQQSLIESVEAVKKEKQVEVIEVNNIPELVMDLSNVTFDLPVVDNNMSYDNLDKLKMPEIKKMAEGKNISLTKKVGTMQKQKTKKELIDELLNKDF